MINGYFHVTSETQDWSSGITRKDHVLEATTQNQVWQDDAQNLT